jgi:hypothetical protein
MKERILGLCARGKIAINVRGTEYLQVKPGENEETAWKRLRSKLSDGGRLLDDVLLLEPSAVPATGGAAPPKPQGGTSSGGNPPGGGTGTGNLFPGIEPTGGSASVPQPVPIFGGGGTGTTQKPRISLNSPATSPLNLFSKLEGWGIGPATQVAEVSIKVSAATGAQLQNLLKKLPDGMTFELSLEKEENG